MQDKILSINHTMKHILYLLTLTMLLSACGQGTAPADNLPMNPPDTLPGPKESVVKPDQHNPLLDSIDRANQASVIASGDNITRAYVSRQDSAINLRSNIRIDHRIFGYASPDTTAERLLLLSVFTNDVQNNPFGCKLGAYYDTGGMNDMHLKYLGTAGGFIKAAAINQSNEPTILYFEKKWVEFE